MKNKFILAAISATMLCAGQAFAFTATGSMPVTLTNIGSATVSTTPVAFGNVHEGSTNLATGAIVVNATNTLPYRVSIDAGLHKAGTGLCRQMMGVGPVPAPYALYRDAARLNEWGDTDLANTCFGNTNNGGASLVSSGTGAAQTLVVYASTTLPWSASLGLGSISDTVTVTVTY